MPAVLDITSGVSCQHGAKATLTPTQGRVKILGQLALTQPDQAVIAGCPFTIPTSKPSPCIAIQWTVVALRVKASGLSLLLQTSVGLCKSPEQAPQGAPIISAVQPRVQAL